MTVCFEVLGTEIKFDDSVRLYYQVTKECNQEVKNVWEVYNKYNTNSTENVKELLTAAQNMVIKIHDTYLKPNSVLPEESDYDSKEAFIEAAESYLSINAYYDLYKSFDKKLAETISEYYDKERLWIQDSSAQLQARIDKVISEHERDASNGLGFGIISNSITAHLLYSGLSLRNVDKIKKECEGIIQSMEKEHEQQVAIHRADTDQNVWKAFKPHVEELTSKIHPTTIFVLGKWKIISPAVLKTIREAKAVMIAKNIPYAEDKKSAILEALSLCPYCEDVFDVAVNEGITDVGLDKLRKFFL